MFLVVSVCSSGSSGRVREGPRNMKSMQLPSVAIFFMTYFHRAGGGMAPSAPPGSATESFSEKEQSVLFNQLVFGMAYIEFNGGPRIS